MSRHAWTAVLALGSTLLAPAVCAGALAGGCPLPPLPQQPPAGAVDVTRHGAVPDDERPDDEAVQHALAALRPGDWLVFPPGRYRFERRIEVRVPGVTLWGRGAELLALDSEDQALAVRASGVRVIGFSLQGRLERRRTTPDSARLSVRPPDEGGAPLTGVVLRDNRITSGASAGIFVSGVVGFTVAGNRVSGTLADGIHVTGGASDGRVLGNRVERVGDDGIAVVSYQGDRSPVQRVWVEDNEVDELPWGRGLSVVGGQDVTLRHNRVARVQRAAGVLVAREDGWHTAGVQRVLVEGNLVRDTQPGGPVTGHAAIEIHALGPQGQVRQVMVRDNRIEGGSTDGVRLGADSRPGALRQIQLLGNRIEGVQGDRVAVLVQGAQGAVGDSALPPRCERLP